MSKTFSKEKRLLVYLKYNKKCAYCGDYIELSKMHIDHIIPKYRGYSNQDLEKYNITKGTDELHNLNPSCISCNVSKSTFKLEDWRKQIFLKIERERNNSTNFRILERFGLLKVINKEIVFYFEKINKNG
jgi:5-methylcytosine-specific restriction endonuclease McrA